VAVTEVSLIENVNKTAVRRWTEPSLDRHSEVRSRDALDTIAHGAIAKLDPMKWATLAAACRTCQRPSGGRSFDFEQEALLRPLATSEDRGGGANIDNPQ
jgi:hypothetical protein